MSQIPVSPMEEKKQKKIAKEEDLTDQRHDDFVFAFGHKGSPTIG